VTDINAVPRQFLMLNDAAVKAAIKARPKDQPPAPVPGIEFIRKHQPLILHGFVGADLARRLFGVRDKEVLSAVAKHTLAAEKMSRLEKVVYLADHLSPDRKSTGVDDLRRLAREDLDRAFLESLRNKMIFILMKNQPLHPGAEKIWNRHRALLKD
jgi:predicted HD superfamily hydrolase involved in NAD metabolism